MYRENLVNQWDDIVRDFVNQFSGLPGCTVSDYNNWYRTRIFSFRSGHEIEGILLEQQEKPEFSRQLKDKLSEFSFQKIEKAPLPTPLAGTVLGAVLGGLVFALLPFLPADWSKLLIVRILLGIGVFIGMAVWQICSVQKARKEAAGKMFEEYTEQLKAHLSVLLKVCDQNHIE